MKLIKHVIFCGGLLLPCYLQAVQLNHSEQSKAKTPPGGAIASASSYATKAGMKILRQGGNAFDAAVAVSAVLAVTEPYHSGLGGGGFWLLHNVKQGKNIFVDGRERAPLNSTTTMYQGPSGKVIKGASLYGPEAAAIPGEPAALAHISKHYGRLPLSKTLAPAIELAEKGFVVDNYYHQLVSRKPILMHLREYPSTAAIFLSNNNIPEVGALIKQPKLAMTLRLLATKGRDGFYQGKFASQLVADVRAAGGIWTKKDLAQYKVIEREPLRAEYDGMKIVTAPPPSAGGVALITMFNILKAYPLSELQPFQRVHYILEAMRLAYWDRAQYLGDPDFVDLPLKRLLSKEHVNALREYIRPDRATPSAQLGRPAYAFLERSVNTTHFSILDNDGNMVAATMSINFLFGSSFVAKHSGLLLNDEMDDFSSKPGVKNVFSLVGSYANRIEPGKRPLSSMSPTFLFTPNRLAVLGTPGGSRIPTMVFLAALNFSEGKGPLSFVSLPRYHHQYLPDRVQFESDAFDVSMIKLLGDMGYRLSRIERDYGGASNTYGDMQALMWDKEHQKITAVSDPRHSGLALVNYR